ncbi:MAG: PDZ domain-containing protein [Candidatus Aegiribacteria sp.]
MINLLLIILVSAVQSSFMDDVHTVRVADSPGSIELCTSVAISSRHAAVLSLFSIGDSVSVETPSGFHYPDSIIASPDLGMMIMCFDEGIFDSYQEPSTAVPSIGDEVTIVGQGLNGLIEVRGHARERYPDGSFLVSAGLRDGLMGAAVFSDGGDFLGMITGIISTSRQFPSNAGREYLVLYPSQIWYMWAMMAVMEKGPSSQHSFGVTALSSISLTDTRPSGIHLVSVHPGSMAWECGLRPGDLITHIDSTPVYHPETLRGLLILSEDTLAARVMRENYQREIFIPPFQ